MPKEKADFGFIYTAAEQIIKQLGVPIDTSAYAGNASTGIATHRSQGSNSNGDQPGHQVGRTPTKPAKVDKARLASLVHELQDTETRYLKRITCLKTVSRFDGPVFCLATEADRSLLSWIQSYADPLRKFARRSETMIIPVYDAKVMFANIDAIVEAAEGFCRDLQEVDLTGRARDRNIGDVCLYHVRACNRSIPHRNLI